jgi:peptidylprolyl isomerase
MLVTYCAYVLTSLALIVVSRDVHGQERPSQQPIAPASDLQEAPVVADPSVDITRLSEAFGHLIGKNIESVGVHFDVAQLIKGLQDAVDGKDAVMSELDCMQSISKLQENAFNKKAADNLREAEDFLKKRASDPGVISLEDGKVLYTVDRPGSGPCLEAHCSPILRYKGSYQDGTVFSASEVEPSDAEDTSSLDELIAGLRVGLLGMHEGEKRTIDIHPTLGYGVSGYLAPNALLTFEVELIKADAPPPVGQDPFDQPIATDAVPEIAPAEQALR